MFLHITRQIQCNVTLFAKLQFSYECISNEFEKKMACVAWKRAPKFQQKNAKWTKIPFWGSILVPEVAFWGDTNLDQVTWRGLGPPILKVPTFSACSLKSYGHKLSDELSGSPLASILSERRALTLLRGGGHGELQKSTFFAYFASARKFCEEKFYQDRTMWKSMASAFRICMTLGGPDDLSHSYCSSKSEDGGKSESVIEIMRC